MTNNTNKNCKPVQLRGGFSDRNGINRISTEIQLTDFDQRTRVAIINALNHIYSKLNSISQSINLTDEDLWLKFYLGIQENLYIQEIKDIDSCCFEEINDETDNDVRNTILSDTYDKVLTVVEYILNWTEEIFQFRLVSFNEKQYMNQVFEKECVGYRFVGDNIVAIIDSVEIDEIERSLNVEFNGCKNHIQKALHYLSD